MLVGIPKETKDHEFRVGATPEMVRLLVREGHEVLVQRNAGSRIGYPDEAYVMAGARIVETPAQIYEAEMVVKVKEPQPSEYGLLKEGQVLFCFLHLAPDPQQTQALIDKKVIGIAYETVTDPYGRLPLLVPMSELAGRIGIQAGATALHMNNGGRGVLLGGVPGVPPAKVVVIGGGIVGTESAKVAMGLGAEVTVLDRNLDRLRKLQEIFGMGLKTRFSTEASLEDEVEKADLVIGAVLIPGACAPKLVKSSLVRRMRAGAVIVDIAIDQGGCCETSQPTTHSNPTYVVDDVVHYCVTNMPGACARTATQALTHATMSYVIALANKGYQRALADDAHFREGLNVCLGAVTNRPVADDLGYDYVEPENYL